MSDNPFFNNDSLRRLPENEFTQNRHIWEDWINENMKKTNRWISCYGLKQRLTDETGIYLYEADMYHLLTDLGFDTQIGYNGKPWAKACYRKRPKP